MAQTIGDLYQAINRLHRARAAELADAPLKPTACAKCGRVFTSPSQYRWAAGLKAHICRDARACRIREGEKP